MKEVLDYTLGEALRKQAAKRGNSEFLVFSNRNIRYTFGDIDKKADDLARWFLASGFKKGDHIGIWAYNVPEWAPVFYAAARVGIMAVPINANCKHKELGFILAQADINGLFIVDRFRDSDFAEILYQLIPELKTSSAGNLKSAAFPSLRMVANIDNITHQGMYVLEDLILSGSKIDSTELSKAESKVSNNDVLCIMYTSGTTGIPKGAMLTHKNVVLNCYHTVYSPNKLGMIDENTIILNPLPFFYITSLAGGIVFPLIYGFKIVVLENFDITRCLEVIQNEACTWIFAVPSLYMAMLSHPRFNDFNMESVNYGCIGGAVCPPDLMRNIINKFRMKGIFLAYGLTETSPFITTIITEDPADPRLSTVGLPLFGVEVSIRDPNHIECPVNVPGEIWTRGHNVMKGYYKMEEATREAIDKDGWFHTGDLGHLLSNGCLAIDGRIKELIIRGGENIYPKEVEVLLRSMPGIKDAQVAGIPSKKYGEEVAAFVILNQGELIGEKDIIEFCKDKISFFKTPKYSFFLNSFPLSANGKVQTFKLVESGLKELEEKGIDI
ncbi:AMP-binding protein [Leadbettera azotonutricia]|uniref:AMP-dependent synthetase and ligase n=1 Tax=Leadbettera azotonutricia (strain ATCC BAA-888 / DSM 13862 / ZAS-9) TaxID=545695 RepID=F5YES8_LEAAZ|nr:AMP-binding protein [Leadbettera azotonutricia]AEF80139.1 AMP-dependent synthetase and ligase [Leadbettera azotonutricia ZAS-9]